VAYARAVVAALEAGANVVDTAPNYRTGRSERAVGAGLRVFLNGSAADRSSVVVASKGGFISHASDRSRVSMSGEVIDGCHCLAPDFLDGEVARSRQSLGIDVIDIYFLHNPEYQLRAVSSRELQARLRRAFGLLETKVEEGSIGRYGVSTWSGLWNASLAIKDLVGLASEVAGDDHHLHFVQLPFNRTIAQLATRSEPRPILEAAALGVGVLTSATLAGVEVSAPTAAPEQAIRFACLTAGVTTALVGMRREEHVTANIAAAVA
jgi:aryl-alcohol dehydrogenase-like predicted oxidoreductase